MLFWVFGQGEDMGKNLLVFGEDWGKHPSTLMHIARSWIQEQQVDRVVWVNSLGMRSPTLSWVDLRRLIQKACDLLLKKNSTNKSFCSSIEPDFIYPLCLPFWQYNWVCRLNACLLAWQIKRKMADLSVQSYSVISNIVTCYPVLSHLSYDKCVYVCQDDFEVMPGVDHGMAHAMEKALISVADHLVVVSEVLQKKWQSFDPVICSQGVDFDLFASPRSSLLTYSPPVIGFWGTLEAWVDLSFFCYLAQNLPNATLLILGRSTVDVSVLRQYPNIHLKGVVPYHTLPSYGQHWDVSILPFKDNAITAACDPLKIYEYLALGKPIVSTTIPSISHLSDVIDFADTKEDFLQAVKVALSGGGEKTQTRQMLAKEQFSWHTKAKQLLALL